MYKRTYVTIINDYIYICYLRAAYQILHDSERRRPTNKNVHVHEVT